MKGGLFDEYDDGADNHVCKGTRLSYMSLDSIS